MNFAGKSVIYENPLDSFTCRKAGTWDILFYFPSEGRHTEDFPDARKIQRLRPGLNPRTRVPVASMLTTRPPKPSKMKVTHRHTEHGDAYVMLSFQRKKVGRTSEAFPLTLLETIKLIKHDWKDKIEVIL